MLLDDDSERTIFENRIRRKELFGYFPIFISHSTAFFGTKWLCTYKNFILLFLEVV